MSKFTFVDVGPKTEKDGRKIVQLKLNIDCIGDADIVAVDDDGDETFLVGIDADDGKVVLYSDIPKDLGFELNEEGRLLLRDKGDE